jgi:hypothetical protein
MFTGTVINELMEMVARAEDHAQDRRTALELEREDRQRASYFAYLPADSQPMMNGVA